jgi:hypothetical protein
VGQKRLDLRRPHVAEAPLIVCDTKRRSYFGPDAVVLPPDPISDLAQQTGLSVTHTDLRRCTGLSAGVILKGLILAAGLSYIDPRYSLLRQKKNIF